MQAALALPYSRWADDAQHFYGAYAFGERGFGTAVFAAPALVLRLDRPCAEETLAPAARAAIAEWAARTWNYFETFCKEEKGFLPPDNFQEAPLGVTVDNTSPTNIGMAMLSTVAAHLLGMIDVQCLILRLERMAERIEDAEKWNGHLYNWYALEPFVPLDPRYVSTVDSGNLAACLLACESALLSFGTKEQKRWRAACAHLRRVWISAHCTIRRKSYSTLDSIAFLERLRSPGMTCLPQKRA